jgi:hypothetical protein
LVPAVATEQLVVLGSECLRHEGHLALGTLETLVMPVLLLERQVLVIDRDNLLTFLAVVGEQLVVALHTVGVTLPVDEPVSI